MSLAKRSLAKPHFPTLAASHGGTSGNAGLRGQSERFVWRWLDSIWPSLTLLVATNLVGSGRLTGNLLVWPD
jgi:hypothetical protein